MKKYSLLGGLLLSAILTIGTTTYAREEQITVADVDMVLYATSEAEILATPDNNNVIIPKSGVEDGLGISVTGITSNGFFRVNLGDGNVYYVAGNGLTDRAYDKNGNKPYDDWAYDENGNKLYDDSYYDENGNFNPYTDEVAGPYIPSETTPTTTPSTNTNYALPYIVNGIDIRSGDVDGDGISDNHQNTWFEGRTWTSSAGYVLRVADGFEIYPGNMNVYSVFIDGTEDLRPGSDFMLAYDEFTGRAYKTQISAADLPNVVPVSTKQTTINPSYPSFVAYKKAFDPLWQKQNGANLAQLQPYDANQDGIIDGIGLLSLLGSSGYMWQMDYKADKGYWVLTIKSNYTELIWDSIHNSISMITPDADAVFDTIYYSYYSGDGALVVNYNQWVTIGNTQVQATDGGHILIN